MRPSLPVRQRSAARAANARQMQLTPVRLGSAALRHRARTPLGGVRQHTFQGQSTSSAFHHDHSNRAGVAHEFVFVEWNAVSGRPFLAEILGRELPWWHGRFVVDRSWHERLSLNPFLVFMEFSRNVGLRRARGRFLLTTNTDIWLSRDVPPTLLGSCQRSCLVLSGLISGERSRYFGSVPSAGLCAYATAMVEPWVSRGGPPWQELLFMWAVTVVSAWESFRVNRRLPQAPSETGPRGFGGLFVNRVHQG
jgi:hypothetical protein